MVSLKSLISGALVAAVAVAQAPNATFSDDLVMSLLNKSGPNSPDSTTRLNWCSSQMTLCGKLCNSDSNPNMCDPDTLKWTCTCPGNNSAPGLEYYPFSITGNECNALKGNCFHSTENDGLQAQQACNTTFVCGGANDSDATAAAAGGSSSSSGDSSSSVSSSPSSTSAPASASPSTKPNAAPSKYAIYGPGMIAMSVLGAIMVSL